MKNYFLAFFLFFILVENVSARDCPQIDVQELVKTTMSWDGQTLPAYPEGQPEVTILHITIPPGATLHRHKHPVINAGVLIQGELTVVTEEDEILHLKAGEAIVEVMDKWHYGINPGEEPAEIIVFYAGVEGLPVSVLDGYDE